MKTEREENEARKQILRKATRIVKTYPFFYTIIFILCMLVYYIANEKATQVVDMLFSVTPIAVFPFVMLSRVFKLCNWHRFQCILPMFPMAAAFASIFVDLSFNAVLLNISATILVFILTLVNAYFVFIKPKKK